MADAVFAPGPGEAFFAESPNSWFIQKLPARLQAKFSDTTGSKVAWVYHMVLGVSDSFWISWRGTDQRNYFAHSGLPESLSSWITTRDAKGNLLRNTVQLRIALGPHNASYWASDGSWSLWFNLPAELSWRINDMRTPDGQWRMPMPKHVALGVNGTYVLIYAGAGASWSLGGHYSVLHDALEALRNNWASIHYLAMDQHEEANFLLTTTSGGWAAYVPDNLDKDMLSVFNAQAGFIPPTGQTETSAPTLASRPSVSNRSIAPSRPNVTSRRRGTGGPSAEDVGKVVGGVLKLGLRIMAAAAVQSAVGNGSGGNGGDGGSGGLDLLGQEQFQASTQDQMWSSVDSAASDPIV